jgi:hypothetical protein
MAVHSVKWQFRYSITVSIPSSSTRAVTQRIRLAELDHFNLGRRSDAGIVVNARCIHKADRLAVFPPPVGFMSSQDEPWPQDGATVEERMRENRERIRQSHG